MAGKKMGAPRKFSEADVERALQLIAQGVPVRRLKEYKEQGVPTGETIRTWLVEVNSTCPVANFPVLYARAMEERMDNMAEDIIEISDDSGVDISINDEGNPEINGEAIARARLRVDTRKWVMAKLAPKKYGDAAKLTLAGDADAPVAVTIMDSIPRKKRD